MFLAGELGLGEAALSGVVVAGTEFDQPVGGVVVPTGAAVGVDYFHAISRH